MIRFFLYALAALGIGAALALLLAEDPGYVLVYVRGYSIEATLGAVLLALLVLALALLCLGWLLRLSNPLRWIGGGLFKGHNPVRASAHGLHLLLLGQWQEAYRLLVENAERVDNPVANYLAASLAAYQRGDPLGWTWCLEQAEKKTGGGTAGIKSLKALLQSRTGQPEQALAQLLALNRVVPGSPFVLSQIKDIDLQLCDWEGLAKLLPELEKHKVLPAPELGALSEEIHAHRLEQAASSGLDSLRLAWQDLPKPLRASEKLAAAYIRQLVRFGQDTEALALVSRLLKQTWSDDLVGLLGHIDTGSPQEHLLLLENLLKQRPNNAVLLLTLGRLCMRNQLWGKAREYFEHALRAVKSASLEAEISAELGRLLEHLGEHDHSLASYQRAMGLMEHKLPELPLPLNQR